MSKTRYLLKLPTVTLIIKTPEKDLPGEFKVYGTVGSVIKNIVGYLGYDRTGYYTLHTPDGEILNPHSSLGGLGLKDGDVLYFSDRGSEV